MSTLALDGTSPVSSVTISSEDSSPRELETPIEKIALETFQASARPVPSKSLCDYAIISLAVILFPLTAIYYVAKIICSFVAYKIGVTGDSCKEVDTAKRDALIRLGGEVVHFKTEDNKTLEGMYFQNKAAAKNAKTILICAGSHLSYENYTVPMVEALLKMGHNVMVFNYRGFGNSEGSASEDGFYLDAEAAYQYIRDKKGASDTNIVAWGYSMGSAVATDLASHHKINVVLDRYFSSMDEVARDAGDIIAKGIFSLGGASFNMRKKIQQVQGNILLVRGTQDETMRPKHEQYLLKSLSERSSSSRVEFAQVDTRHEHSSSYNLWFHEDNHDAAARALVTSFLD